MNLYIRANLLTKHHWSTNGRLLRNLKSDGDSPSIKLEIAADVPDSNCAPSLGPEYKLKHCNIRVNPKCGYRHSLA